MTENSLSAQIQKKIDFKTKPIGALGQLEAIAFKIANLQQTLSPIIKAPHLVVFAADHGIAKTGLVNPYPQAVTAQMVLNFLNGGAAINVFTKQHGIALKVVDAGVNAELPENKSLINAKVAFGTQNYAEGTAILPTERAHAIVKGQSIVAEIAKTGCNYIGFGEMGIGNTSSASLIMAAILQLPIASCVGKGTGASEALLTQKKQVLEAAFNFHQLNHFATNADAILEKVGGLEIAMMVGAYLEAYKQNMLIVVDGFIATAALLLAKLEEPAIVENCVFSHCSNEQGHKTMLAYLQAKPILQLDLRLGEGTGVALAYPIIQSALAFFNQMASFADAGVSTAE